VKVPVSKVLLAKVVFVAVSPKPKFKYWDYSGQKVTLYAVVSKPQCCNKWSFHHIKPAPSATHSNGTCASSKLNDMNSVVSQDPTCSVPWDQIAQTTHDENGGMKQT